MQAIFSRHSFSRMSDLGSVGTVRSSFAKSSAFVADFVAGQRVVFPPLSSQGCSESNLRKAWVGGHPTPICVGVIVPLLLYLLYQESITDAMLSAFSS